MCLSSGLNDNAQIDRFVEHGMPQRIVRTIKYTLKKRVAALHKTEAPMEDIQTISEEEDSAEKLVVPLITLNAIPDDIVKISQIPKMCGRFRKLHEANSSQLVNEQHCYTDILAIGTQWTHQLLQRVNKAVVRLQHHKIYILLTKTTQPAHVIAVLILAFVLAAIGPYLIDNKVNQNNFDALENQFVTVTPLTKSTTMSKCNDIADTISTYNNNNDNNNNKYQYQNDYNRQSVTNSQNNNLAVIIYLAAFATHFGAQIWMTFVSGLSLYFSLPRHTFGQCQQILFPKYFALNGALSIGMLVVYVRNFTHFWTLSECLQLGALAICAIIEVTVRLYLAPPMLRLMHEKYKIEDAIGSGQEVGSVVQGDLAQCPHYQRIHKLFRRIHMTIATGNMIVLLATCLHLYFLASKIQLA